MSKDAQCQHCLNKLCMHKVPIFSMLNHEELVRISEWVEHREYKRGEAVFNAGDKVDSLMILNEGHAKAYKYTPDGREQILYVFSEGDFFGEQYLLSKGQAAYTVEALVTVRLCKLSRSQFQQLLFRYPHIAVKIIEELGERMGRLESTMQSMGVRSVDARIGALIMDFSSKYGKPAGEGVLVQLPLSREGMANYLGIARETVSRKLGQMENEGIIRSVSNKSLLILNKEALKEIADLNLK